MRHDLDEAQETHTFRGRSMQDAVGKLKARLGADAVIVATRRGREPGGGFVEITAVGRARSAPVEAVEAVDPPAMGGARGASAAYARAARAPVAAREFALPPLLAALRGEAPRGEAPRGEAPRGEALRGEAARGEAARGEALRGEAGEKPFAERAAWLSRLVEARTAEEAAAAARAARLAHRPPYHSVADGPASAGLGGAGRGGAGHGARSAAGEGADAGSWAASLAAENARYLAEDAGRFDDAAIAATLAGLRGDLMALAARQGPLIDELAGLRAMVEHNERESRAVVALRARLIDVGISAEHARDLAERALCDAGGAADDGEVLARVGCLMAGGMACGGGDFAGRRVLAFVGPTGVGKTTTVAKVAARARLAGRRVALITVDTFRMAAVDQLARYAEVLDAPLRVVRRPDALPGEIAALSAFDLVLVDTSGQNPRAADQVRALAKFFPPGWGGELVLTVAASTRERDLFATVDAFARLGYARLCVTKTDETDAPGVVYSVARRAARPVCWITDGQRVPDDIEAADGAVIAARILAAEWTPAVALGA